MTTDVTEAALIDFIREQILHASAGLQIDPDQPLLEEGVLDSVGLQQLVTFIEQEWGITLEDEHLAPDNFATVNALVALIRVILERGQSEVRID